MFITSDELELIAQHNPSKRPETTLMRAAVAIILRDGDQGTEFLLMQRAFHELDPWSGQMSFPGGKVDPIDVNAKAAAIREAREEVGLDLSDEDYIGRLDDVYGIKVDNKYSVHVACFVFKPSRELVPVGNHEVEDLVWLPFSYLADNKNAHDYYHPSDRSIKMPAVLIDESKQQILWGLSLRMLSILYELLDWDLAVVSDSENQTMRELEKRNVDSASLSKATKHFMSKAE